MSVTTHEQLVLSDGYPAAVRWWRPDNPCGAVLYFHGIQSHGGWYEQSGQCLADAGLTVLMPDRRGSGRNQEQRGHVESLARCLADGSEALDALLRETGQSAAHLVGVSWGGKLAVALSDACPSKVASLSLVAPGIFPQIDLPKAEKLRIAFALLNDRDRAFDIPLNEPRLFTSNPKWIQYLEQDNLKLTRVTASFLLTSRRMDRITHRFHRSPWRGPLHLLLAGQDQIIRNEATRDWLKALPNVVSTLTEYPEAEHTIEFVVNPAPFFNDLTGWIIDRGAENQDHVTQAR